MLRSVLVIVLIVAVFPKIVAAEVIVSSIEQLSSDICSSKRLIIKRDIDLQGRTFTLPHNSTLVFCKGCIKNGVIVGDNSNIKADKDKLLFQNVVITGLWRVDKIWSAWFDFSETDAKKNTQNFRNLCTLSDDDHHGTVTITKAVYTIIAEKQGEDIICPNSKTKLIIEGMIVLQPNAFKNYSILCIDRKYDVTVCGSGSIVGDVDFHTGTEGEWGMGIDIESSKNVLVRGLTIEKCWGDCIYIGQRTQKRSDYSENVVIENVTCDKGRRQGLSLITGKNITIKNSRFINTGAVKVTSPGAGIDIEPNTDDATLVNIEIDNCEFYGNDKTGVGDILACKINKTADITIKNCTLHGRLRILEDSYNILVKNCRIKQFINKNKAKDSGVELIECKIRGNSHVAVNVIGAISLATLYCYLSKNHDKSSNIHTA